MKNPGSFCDLILPLSVPGSYTYSIPEDLRGLVVPGKRVLVQFGRNKQYAALVRRLHDKSPELFIAKEIIAVIDTLPIINELQFLLWEWMSDYYMCFPGEVMAAALPRILKPGSHTRILINPLYNGSYESLNSKEQCIIEALSNREYLDADEIEGITGIRNNHPALKKLLDQQIILSEEYFGTQHKGRTTAVYSLHPDFEDESNLNSLMDKLGKRALAQFKLMLRYLELRAVSDKPAIAGKELQQHGGNSSPVLKALVAKGILLKSEIAVSCFEEFASVKNAGGIILSGAQEEALQALSRNLGEKNVTLLHGMTSSGKTELYIRLIAQIIEKGQQVLYLLPEIALTSQITARLQSYFGSLVGVYHSRLNDSEKAEVWHRVFSFRTDGKSFPVILGARSSLFLPYSRLGLVIVDEEHDTSYKQQDPAPRYHARDMAVVLAGIHQAPVLLGSATPSLESYANAVSGKYGLVNLHSRYGGYMLPAIKLVNLKEEMRKRRMKSHFSTLLLEKISQALQNKEQVILFQNRRGFSRMLCCDECGWVPHCRHCDVTLVYHKLENLLRCHYCGYNLPIPSSCPDCGGHRLQLLGFGTEKIEDELPLFFPGARIQRMDLDTMRGRQAFRKAIEDFSSGRVDILIGTQMVTKGLDFDRVSLVGVMNADNLLSFPDFRSTERGFQLLTQVSGRAGRKTDGGTVVIQTYDPVNPAIEFVLKNDYGTMFRHVMNDRLRYKYPPYYRLIRIEMRHRNDELLRHASETLAELLNVKLYDRVLGPEHPLIGRVKGQWIMQIIIKLERDAMLADMKKFIKTETEKVQKNYASVKMIIDVDPY